MGNHFSEDASRLSMKRTSAGKRAKVMDDAQAEAFVIRLLQDRGPSSTMEIERLARKEHRRCPDQTVVFLTKMKKKGLIKGEVSVEKRGWLWSIP